MRFTVDCLPLKSLDGLVYRNEAAVCDTPTFYRGTFDAKAGIDTFLDMGGWHKGVVWVNGFNLGRYWKVGPQRTLYLPGELLKEHGNVIEVLEINIAKEDLSVTGLDHSLLTEEVESTLLSTDFRLL